MHSSSAPSFPQPVLWGAAGVIGLALVLAGAGRLSGTDAADPSAGAIASVDLRFEDRDVGGVSVIDVDANREVATILPGEGGFVRGALRALVRERKRQDLGPEAPFRLVQGVRGELSLADPVTGTSVLLDAFGPTQVQAFARLMNAKETSR